MNPFLVLKLRDDRWAWAGWPNRHMLRSWAWMKRPKRRRLNFRPRPAPLEREAQREGFALVIPGNPRERR